MTTLVIVESPGKVKKIASILGGEYTVMASVGHVRDLPQKEMGVEPPKFVPQYEPSERGAEILAKLGAAVRRASRVLLATDPDREGEAIAWHLADALSLKDPERITFTAITPEKVLEAVANPRRIDFARVRSQEARRVADRLFGYMVSPVLSDQAGQNLSAGRVQSPAVRLVVEREREIRAFKAVDHFGAELAFDGGWCATLDTKPLIGKDEAYLLDGAVATAAASARSLTVKAYEDKTAGRAPSAPFTTSTLQQAAGTRLKLTPKQTMELAQKLYEQGAITYHRTDNPNLDAAGLEDIAAYAKAAGLPLSGKKRTWKAKDGAQEGHEAIRPTHADALTGGQTPQEQALYQLIWQRAVASQLADATYAVRSAVLTADVEGRSYSFTATGRTLTDKGWMTVYAEDTSDEDDKEEDAKNPVPALTVGAAVTATGGKVLRKKTKPPSRYKLPSLVAALEKHGIGRPSTYASILEAVMARGYITDGKLGLQPTSIGELVYDGLTQAKMQFIELAYTAQLEDLLDGIATGKAKYADVLQGVYDRLQMELSALSAANISPAHPCPNCGKALRRRKGDTGFYWSCTGYPDCKTTLPDDKGKPGTRKAAELADAPCPSCGKPLARRKGTSKKTKKPYDFYSCTGYPACEASFMTKNGQPDFDNKLENKG